MAIPQIPMLSFAQPARPMPIPARNGCLRIISRPVDGEHHRQRLVVGAGQHSPDQTRVGDRQQRRPGLPSRVAVGQHDRSGAGDHERDEREHLQPEHDVVHVLPAQPVGGQLGPGGDRAVHARGVGPGELDPAHHRVELAADHLGRGDLVRVAAERLQPAVGGVHQDVGRGQGRHEDGGHAERGCRARTARFTAGQPAVGEGEACRPAGPSAPRMTATQIIDGDDPLVGLDDPGRQVPRRQVAAAAVRGSG